MPEEKRKINAWIPVSLYDKLENAGYDNITQALTKALEKFFEDPQEDITGYKQDMERIQEGYRKDIEGYIQDITGYKQDIEAFTAENTQLKEDLSEYHRIQDGYKQDIEGYIQDTEKLNQDISGYRQDIKALQSENVKLKDDLAKAPDLVEFVQLQARYEAIKMVLEEKDKRIEGLENDMKKADHDKEGLKTTYNNYFLQIQTLINQRVLGAPTEPKETTFNYVVQEKPDIEYETEDKPAARKEEQGQIQKNCIECNTPFTTDNQKRVYCSRKCKDTVFRRNKKERESAF